jgi:hypothetical protein
MLLPLQLLHQEARTTAMWKCNCRGSRASRCHVSLGRSCGQRGTVNHGIALHCVPSSRFGASQVLT